MLLIMLEIESIKCLFTMLAEHVEDCLFEHGHGVRNTLAFPKPVHNFIFLQNCFVPLRAPSAKKTLLAILIALVALLRSDLYLIRLPSDGDFSDLR